MADTLDLTYTGQQGQGTTAVSLSQFSGTQLPRNYLETTSLDFSATGSAYLVGPSYRSKYLWSVSVLVPISTAGAIEKMFEDWDRDRGAGYASAVSVTDSLTATTKTASAVFSTPPTFDKSGPNHFFASFGLTEV